MSFSSHQDDAFVRSIKAIVDRTNLSQAEVLLGRSRRSISRIVSGLRPKQIMADVWLRDRVEKSGWLRLYGGAYQAGHSLY